MKPVDIKRLAVTIVFVGQEALKVPEMWQKVKQLNPYITQREIFLLGLEQVLKTHQK